MASRLPINLYRPLSSRVTHGGLLSLNYSIGLPSLPGMCHGKTGIFINDWLRNKTDDFNYNLKLLERYQNNPGGLIAELHQIVKIPVENQTKNQQARLKLPLLLQQMHLFQEPGNLNLGIAPSQIPKQYQLREIFKLYDKIDIYNNPLNVQQTFSKTVGFSKATLNKYLIELEIYLAAHSHQAICLSNDDHSVGLAFCKEKKLFCLMDIENFESPPHNSCYVHYLDTTKLTDNLFNSFRDKEDTFFDVYCLASQNNAVVPQTETDTFLEQTKSLIVHPKKQNGRGLDQSYFAARANDVELLERLKSTSSLSNNPSTFSGQSPLFIACRRGHVEAVKFLLENSSSEIVNQTAIKDMTPLHSAVYNNHLEVVKLLIKFGANINACLDNGYETPLMLANLKHHTKIESYLLANGARTDVETRFMPN